MSRFYIGQPVRVNCPNSRWHGAESFVMAVDVPARNAFGSVIYVGTRVALPLSDLAVLITGESFAIFEDHELEPIILPGIEEEAAEGVESEKVCA